MSNVNHYSRTLYPNRALIVLDGELHPLFRLKVSHRELTIKGHSTTLEISTSVMGGAAGKHQRTHFDGECMALGQMQIRLEPSTNHLGAVKLVFVEIPNSFTVLPEAAAKQAAGMQGD